MSASTATNIAAVAKTLLCGEIAKNFALCTMQRKLCISDFALTPLA